MEVAFAAVLDRNEKPVVTSVVTGASIAFPSLGDGINDDGVCKKLNDDVPGTEEEAAGTPPAESSSDCFNAFPTSVAPVVVELVDDARKLKALVPVVMAGAVAATLLSEAAVEGLRKENPDDEEAAAAAAETDEFEPSTGAGCEAKVAEFKNEKALLETTAVAEDDESAEVVVVVLSCRDLSGVPLISKPPNMINYYVYCLTVEKQRATIKD